MTTQRINVDLVPGTSSPSVQVSQGDHELRTIVATLLSGGKKNVTIPDGATVEVRGTKPSGKGFNYSCTFSGDEVTFKVKDQMTAEPGRVVCEIVVELNGKEIGSSNFDMHVESAALQPGTVASSDTFASLVRKVVVSTEGNLFTNALKGYASGASVQLSDVSPLEHSPEVWVHGKNLIPLPYYHGNSITQQGVDITVDAAGVITFNGTALADSAFRLINKASMRVKGRYTLSGCLGGSNTTYYLQPFINDVGVGTVRNGAITYEWDGVLTSLAFFFKKGTVFDNVQFSPQLEKGDTATAYEPWVDPTGFQVTDGKGKTFTPNTDGTVEGVTSTSPTMTLSLDKEGATIDVEYNRDLTAAIERIEAALFN